MRNSSHSWIHAVKKGSLSSSFQDGSVRVRDGGVHLSTEFPLDCRIVHKVENGKGQGARFRLNANAYNPDGLVLRSFRGNSRPGDIGLDDRGENSLRRFLACCTVS